MSVAFNWTVSHSDWPPHAEIKPPYSLTRVEIARSCPLRVVFEASRQYEPLMSFDARIGTAMHAALEHFQHHPPVGNGEEILEQIRTRFFQELDQQRIEAQERPRERRLPENTERINAAIAALLRDVHGLEGVPRTSIPREGTVITQPNGTTSEVERPVHSRDRQFIGRVDRADHEGNQVVLYDYKSALRSDVPERYARQLQMYTEMWAATYGVRPARAFVVYPLMDQRYAVDISPTVTRAALEESRQAVAPFASEQEPLNLARPGDVCKVCSFRPWCQPFWTWVAGATLPEALERSGSGFAGLILSAARQQEYLVLKVRFHPNSVATLLFPWAAFPHLHDVGTGQQLRVLNMRLQGQLVSPRGLATAWTEAFIVTP